MVYCDYTASGRCLHFVENYIINLQRIYANTHTEDDITGRSMTRLLHQAEEVIKQFVNAGEHGRLIACGTGATAAIDKFQQLIGVSLKPTTRMMLFALLKEFLSDNIQNLDTTAFEEMIQTQQPVVFLASYEHHSNEVMWRENLSTVVKVRLKEDGSFDLDHLEELLQDPQYQNRLRIGSFSAASNITGIISPVYEIATLLHQYNALACFDFAACAPYVKIDMNPTPRKKGEDPSLDAIFMSPHKFLGGPGSTGVLVFNEKHYHRELPPSVSGGGTVSYVWFKGHDFLMDIEARERAGTPGVFQTMKAALAFEIKETLTIPAIEKRENELLNRAFKKWLENPHIQILGNPDPNIRISIISFMVKDPWGQYLHPKFLTVLLNDLFGIQSRAGCSCAGPYGHYLLQIDSAQSEKLLKWIKKGYEGVKPGWCRVGFHYVMDDPEADYIIDAVDFVGHSGYLFLPQYRFDIHSASWMHVDDPDVKEIFSLPSALQASANQAPALSQAERSRRYQTYLEEAQKMARKLKEKFSSSTKKLDGELGELQFFSLLPENEK